MEGGESGGDDGAAEREGEEHRAGCEDFTEGKDDGGGGAEEGWDAGVLDKLRDDADILELGGGLNKVLAVGGIWGVADDKEDGLGVSGEDSGPLGEDGIDAFVGAEHTEKQEQRGLGWEVQGGAGGGGGNGVTVAAVVEAVGDDMEVGLRQVKIDGELAAEGRLVKDDAVCGAGEAPLEIQFEGGESAIVADLIMERVDKRDAAGLEQGEVEQNLTHIEGGGDFGGNASGERISPMQVEAIWAGAQAIDGAVKGEAAVVMWVKGAAPWGVGGDGIGEQ